MYNFCWNNHDSIFVYNLNTGDYTSVLRYRLDFLIIIGLGCGSPSLNNACVSGSSSSSSISGSGFHSKSVVCVAVFGGVMWAKKRSINNV